MSNAFGLLDIKTVTKANVRTVLDYAEKVIRAMCDKKAADELVEEMGDTVKDKLKSGLTNKFRKFVKENVPHGDDIIKAADKYEEVKKKYDSLKQKYQQYANDLNDYKNADKAEKAYKELETAYQVFERMVNNL